MERAKTLLRRVAEVARAVLGAPDYERYVAHMRACHPAAVPMTREEFAWERLEARYSKPGGKCC